MEMLVSRNATVTSEQSLELATGDHANYMATNIVLWACIHGILLVAILSGNILTILAIRCSRKLRSITSNVFIRSLAISDILVAFTLPYHLAFYLGLGLGDSKCWCLLRFFLIINACCGSIWNLIAIAVDRYIAIVYPLHYNRYITKRVALTIIGIGWIASISISIIPIFWNNWDKAKECEFDEILHPWYLAGIVTPVFSLVWLCMLLLYTRIWREAIKHLKQLRLSTSGLNEPSSDWKSVQVVLLIMGCFSICWLPYFIVACSQIFKLLGKSSPTVYRAAFSMAMANSSMNPIIYAWKNTNFRRAFGCLLRCKYPDLHDISPTVCRSKSRSQGDIQPAGAATVINKKNTSLPIETKKISLVQLTTPYHNIDRVNSSNVKITISERAFIDHIDNLSINGCGIVNIAENQSKENVQIVNSQPNNGILCDVSNNNK